MHLQYKISRIKILIFVLMILLHGEVSELEYYLKSTKLLDQTFLFPKTVKAQGLIYGDQIYVWSSYSSSLTDN